MSDTGDKSSRKLSPSVLTTLGLTGIFTSAVRCGPCLDYAVPDTAEDTGDTGDTEDDRRAAPAGEAETREQAARRVLERGVLPEDVARLLQTRREDQE